MKRNPLNIYSGELSETRRKLWRHARQHHDRNPLYRLQAPHGLFVWGHPVWKIYSLAAMTAIFAGVALALAGGRVDSYYWPLWLAAGISALVLLSGFLFVERFTLDTLCRRWSYQRGWRWHVREESGSFDDLAGLMLFSYRRGVLQSELLYGATLEFADGHRFFHAVLADPSLDAARAEAQELARACRLPLKENLPS